jgi:hypothetical protein
MNSAAELFYHRLKHEAKEKYRLWTMVVDWVTWIYILIPVMLIAGRFYITLWTGDAVLSCFDDYLSNAFEQSDLSVFPCLCVPVKYIAVQAFYTHPS